MKFLALFLVLSVVLVAGCVSNNTQTSTNTSTTTNMKEFYMDSFVSGGKPHYSVKELTVKKGDKVVVYVNTTSGTHDFNVDEFNVKSETPAGKITKIEFIADKAGEFVYYCSKPGHRQNGHLGTLNVLE